MIYYDSIIYVLTSFYGVLILYFLRGWMRLREFVPAEVKPRHAVTVVIPVRNEGHHIEALLNDLADQHYPAHLLEVVVVNDFSTDNTVQVVQAFKRLPVQLLHLKDAINPHEPSTAHKKRAIEMAVHAAKGHIVLTTDGDCRMGPTWVATMEACFREKDAVFVAGPVGYFPHTGFLAKFQTLDFLSLVGIAAASIESGFYNLCNGANLGYLRQTFLDVDGYNQAHHSPSGDDMMLMHKMGKKFPGRIHFVRHRNAVVNTYPSPDFRSFWQQRLRWTSKSTQYEDVRITWILAMAYAFNLTLALNVVAGTFNPHFLHLAMWQFIVKLCVDTLFTYQVARFFRRENLLWSFLPAQVMHVGYIIAIAPAAIFGKFKWKDRTF